MVVAKSDNNKLILLDDLETVQVNIDGENVHESKCWHNIKDIADLYLQFMVFEFVDLRNDALELAKLSEKYF